MLKLEVVSVLGRWDRVAVRVDLEGIVVEDVLDGSNFCVIVVFL